MRTGIKRVILASTIFVTSATFAHRVDHLRNSFKDYCCPPPPTLHDGFYVGLQGGYDSYRVRQKINLGAVNSNPVLNASGVVGGILFGYGQPIINDKVYLGAELFANSSNASTTYTSTLGAPVGAYTGKFVVNSNYGGAFLPGYYLTPATLTYIRFGYSYAKMKYTESFTGASAAKSKTSSGLNLGLGLETLLCDRFSGRLEYTHVFYNSFSTSNGTVTNPSNNQVMVALIYHLK